MASAGLNTVRVYTVPPQRLLDVAGAHGLRVIVGLPWEQHVGFLDDPATVNRIIANLREELRDAPAALQYFVMQSGTRFVRRWRAGMASDALSDSSPGSPMSFGDVIPPLS